jgi:8-oxo-dGTP pyrophosphatase MutT (NUDIX family)
MDLHTVIALAGALHGDSDGELEKSRDLVLGLLRFSRKPFSRKQFEPGHITCTGLVFAPGGLTTPLQDTEILLVHHRRLDRWLLPGGHVESDDAQIWDVARREVIEETGVELEHGPQPPLIGIDVHGIPPGKGEPYHLHHDLLFAFRATSRDFQVSSESRAVAWARPDEFDRYDLPGNVRRAVIRSYA